MPSGESFQSFLDYGEPAKERIQRYGSDALSSFLLELPKTRIIPWLNELPAIKGFRPKSPATAEEQRKRLVQRIVGARATGLDWLIFKALWEIWIEEQSKSQAILDVVTGKIDSDPAIVTVEDAIKRFAEICRSEALAGNISRERLSRCIEFGPIDKLEPFAGALAAASSERDLERSRYLDELPGRLANLDSALKELATKSTQLAASDKDDHYVSEISQNLSEATDLLSSLSSQVGSIEARQAETLTSITGLAASIAVQATRLDVIEARSNTAEPTDMAPSQSDAPVERATLVELMSDVQSLSAQVRQLQDALSIDPTAEAADRSLREVVLSATDEAVSLSNSDRGIQFRKQSARKSTPTTFLTEIEDVYNALQINLSAIGLLAESVDSVALEILSATMAGQQISFLGSMASVVVDGCALSMTDDPTVAHIPIGLQNGVDIFDWLNEREHSPELQVLILEAVNASAFEVYGGELRRRILGANVGSVSKGPVVFASLIAEPGGLPLIPSYVELGPIIDTDALTWRTRPTARPIQASRVKHSLIDASLISAADDTEIHEQLSTIIARVPFKSTVVFSRAISRAASIMIKLAREDAVEKTVASIIASWLVPYAIASGMPLQRIRDALLSSPAATATVSSTRMKKLLAVGS